MTEIQIYYVLVIALLLLVEIGDFLIKPSAIELKQMLLF